jgi:hypothetical protein
MIKLFKDANSNDLKGQLHEIFDPPKALIHCLEPFCIWPRIAEKTDNNRISSGSMTPLKWFQRGRRENRFGSCQNRFQRGHWPRQNDFRGVIDPAETAITLLTKCVLRNYEIVKQFKNVMQNFSRIIDPTETISAGAFTPPKRFYMTLLKFQIVISGPQLF